MAGALLLSAPASVQAQQTVEGLVLDRVSGQPVHGVDLFLLDEARQITARAQTDSLGGFRLSAAPGRFSVGASRFGYRYTESDPFVVSVQEDRTVLIQLAPEGIPLAPIRVNVLERGRHEFDRRRALGTGVFLDAVDVARTRPIHVADAFAPVEGIWVTPTSDGDAAIRSLRGWGCLVFFVDQTWLPSARTTSGGHRLIVPGTYEQGVSPREGPPVLQNSAMRLKDVIPSKVRGIEIYRSSDEVPDELRRKIAFDMTAPDDHLGRCGVALIWTTARW